MGFLFPFKNNQLYLTMENEQKAQMYNQLMYEYTRIQNRISSIKGESINLNQQQLNEIQNLENTLRLIMDKVSRL